jgi:hypothetical protein
VIGRRKGLGTAFQGSFPGRCSKGRQISGFRATSSPSSSCCSHHGPKLQVWLQANNATVMAVLLLVLGDSILGKGLGGLL